MNEFAPKQECLPSEGPFEAARDNLLAGMQVLMQGGTDEELATAADAVLGYRSLLTDRFVDYSDERLTSLSEQNVTEWIKFMQHDEQIRSQKCEELSGIPMFEMTEPDDWRKQAISYALTGEEIDFNLADKLDLDPISYLSEEDEDGGWVIDLYDENLVKAIDNLMLFAPLESQEAYMHALERVVRKQTLKLSGDLEIDTAIRVLGKYKPESTVLSELTRIKDLYAQFPDHDDSQPMEIEFSDDDALTEMATALQQSLAHDDLDPLERIWFESMLSAQTSDSSLNLE
jgi:hypothetical protein